MIVITQLLFDNFNQQMHELGNSRRSTVRRESMHGRARLAGRARSSEILLGMASDESVKVLGQDSRGRCSTQTRNSESLEIGERET